MPARWLELIRQVDAAIDAADRDLSDSDRLLFHQTAVRTLTRRRERSPTPVVKHPLPNGDPLYTRDPSGA